MKDEPLSFQGVCQDCASLPPIATKTRTPTPTFDPRATVPIYEGQPDADAALAPTPLAQNAAVKPLLSIVDASPAFAKLTAKTLPKMTVASLPPTGKIYRVYYFAGTQRVAVRERYPQGFGADKVSPAPHLFAGYLLSDHLGSTSVTADADGNLLSRTLYSAWGEVRYASGALPTDYTYTGQYSNTADFGLMYYRARWYDPSLGRFAQTDTVIPEAINPLSYDRYSYVYNNPVRYTDSSGHCIDGISTWACIAVAVGLITKLIDYGWTAWDSYHSAKILSDPHASAEDKMLAGLNVGLAVVFEGAEPDDLFPVGLPLDDAARHAVLKGAKEAFDEGGTELLEKFLRDQLGDHADDVLAKLGLRPSIVGNDLHHIFDKPGRNLSELVEMYGGQKQAYYAVYDEFAKVAGNYSAEQLKDGVQVVVGGISLTVRGVIDDGVVKIGTFFRTP